VAENIATNEAAPLCPVCERSDMVRLYYEHYFCERCSGWLSWLQGSAEWDKRNTGFWWQRHPYLRTRSLYPRRRRAEGCRLRLRRQALPQFHDARARVRLHRGSAPGAGRSMVGRKELGCVRRVRWARIPRRWRWCRWRRGREPVAATAASYRG
jgi:hypothetical protein